MSEVSEPKDKIFEWMRYEAQKQSIFVRTAFVNGTDWTAAWEQEQEQEENVVVLDEQEGQRTMFHICQVKKQVLL